MKLLIKVLYIFGFLGLNVSGDKLVLVQTIWRHGDRSPTETFPLDPNQEDAWDQGWGQLTEWGMRQHVDLGKTLRKRYVDTYGFMNQQYRANEIYVRSTDVNRTMISAMSNLIGMYPGYQNESGHSYPTIPEWPKNAKGEGFVPIAVHTVNDFFDYTLNPDSTCDRQHELWKLVEQTPEYTNLTKIKSDMLRKVSDIAGMNVTLTNLWMIVDALFIEKTWNKKWKDGFDQALFQEMNETNDITEYWNNGLKLQSYQGIDFSVEFPKIRGGSLIWSLIGHMQAKLSCLNNSNQNFCKFFNNLKYYVYSAHDTTLGALFSVLGVPYTNWNEDGYPHYSSCVAVELWRRENGSNYVKFVYFPLDPKDNTGHLQYDVDIPPCNGICTVESMVDYYTKFKPMPDPATLCATAVFPNGNTTPAPADNTTPAATTQKSFGITTRLNLWVIFLTCGYFSFSYL